MRASSVTAVIAIVLMVSACGAHPSVSVQGSGPLAFSQCMRTNGVSNFPDPGGGSAIPKESVQQLGVTDSRFQSAQRACQHLLPNGGRPPNQAQLQQEKAQGLSYARCVRAHGVPSFPDPDSSGRIPDPATVGIDQGSPKFQAANQACGKYRPPYMPSNSAYDAYARTHPNGS
jgi:hypothetical protein